MTTQPQRHVSIGPHTMGNDLPLVVIAGPCQLESRDHAIEVSSALKEMGEAAGVPIIYKSSFHLICRGSNPSHWTRPHWESLRP